MKEMARFRIDSSYMRREMCAILAVSGYPTVVVYDFSQSELKDCAFVVVYEKEDK